MKQISYNIGLYRSLCMRLGAEASAPLMHNIIILSACMHACSTV